MDEAVTNHSSLQGSLSSDSRLPIQTAAWPRVALIGNPSDGYHGKTIACVFNNYAAEVSLQQHDQIVLLDDRLKYDSLNHLVTAVRQHGYNFETALLQATISVFADFAAANEIPLYGHGLHIGSTTTIPRSLGLAGSSAIVTACFRALLQLHRIEMLPGILANWVLRVEKNELKIEAGLQDRVAQAFERPLLMDFAKVHFERLNTGCYQPFSSSLLPPLYIAWRTSDHEPSGTTHDVLRQRFDNQEVRVHQAMVEFSSLTDQFWIAMQEREIDAMSRLMDRNFELRASLLDISVQNLELVNAARRTGASAKFTGSGGAIVGIYRDSRMLDELGKSLRDVGATILLPTVVDRSQDHTGEIQE